MALSLDTLVKVGGGNPQLWLYTSTDTGPTVIASGYFNDATTNLINGDVIIVASNGAQTGMVQVTSATGAATVTTIGTVLALA
mgnify:CR=1 FL=1|tara:strand:- start:698 stop:946 length:249 start_codon:yes stop_codon:yes gene_type:complete